MRVRSTLIAAILLRRGDVDAMLCGTSGAFAEHLNYVRQVIGLREPIFAGAKVAQKQIAMAEGEDDRVLRARRCRAVKTGARSGLIQRQRVLAYARC